MRNTYTHHHPSHPITACTAHCTAHCIINHPVAVAVAVHQPVLGFGVVLCFAGLQRSYSLHHCGSWPPSLFASLWALPVSNKFQDVNSPLTLSNSIGLHLSQPEQFHLVSSAYPPSSSTVFLLVHHICCCCFPACVRASSRSSIALTDCFVQVCSIPATSPHLELLPNQHLCSLLTHIRSLASPPCGTLDLRQKATCPPLPYLANIPRTSL